MSDDDRNVSAREWRAVREGDTHSAPKTSPNNTPESFIVGVGASGALLAGAAIVFVTLVGLVSFNVWPKAQDTSADGNVELNAATKSAPSNATAAPVSAAAGQVASATVGGSGGSAGGNNGGNGGGNGGGKPGGKGGDLKGGPVPTPPSATPTPPSDGSGTTGGGSGGSDNGSGGPVDAIRDPAHPVHPTHPSHPHQSTPVGDKGKDPGDVSSGDSTGVTGKPPFSRPPQTTVTPPSPNTGSVTFPGRGHSRGQQTDSSSDDSPASDYRGHGSTRSRH